MRARDGVARTRSMVAAKSEWGAALPVVSANPRTYTSMASARPNSASDLVHSAVLVAMLVAKTNPASKPPASSSDLPP